MKSKFYILAVAIIMAAVFSGCKKDEPVAPTVVTKTASEITKVSATLKGEITNEGSAPITTCGFYYDSVPDMSYPMVLESKVNGNVFTAALTELNPGTTYYYRAYAVSNAGTSEGEIVRFSTVEAVAPSVSTMPASGVTLVGATLNGNVTEAGGDTITERGFYYGLNEENMSLKVECGSGIGVYSKTLEGLTSATTYYFKAYAINADGASYGEIESFTTSEPSAPEVMTMSATSITSNGATLNGKIVSNGTEPVTVKGFVYGTSESSLTQNVSSTSTSNNFTNEITGLSPSRTYYYKAYAINAIGTTYGEVSSFTTPALVAPSAQTMSATSISQTGATLNGKVVSAGSYSVTARGFVYGTSATNLSQNVESTVTTDNFNKAISGLAPSTTYYYKAYAVNSVGTSYGEVTSFTTLAPTAPTVVTGVATNITSQGATLNGNVTSDGGANVTARGFVYGTNQNNLTQNVSCGTGTGSMNYNLTLSVGGTYYYKAYATNSIGTTYGEVKTFDMTYINGHEYVDLGLPSGNLWATCNVGASSPTDVGGTYYYTTVTWGGGWTMPTRADFQELIGTCSYVRTTESGQLGYRFTGPNGRSIFMPCTDSYSDGYYWSSTTSSSGYYYYLYLPYSSGTVNINGSDNHYNNYRIRPIHPAQN